MITGYKRPLVEEDVWKLRDEYTSEFLSKRFEEEWGKEIQKMRYVKAILSGQSCIQVLTSFYLNTLKKVT